MATVSKFSPDQAKLSISTSPISKEKSHSKSASHIPQVHGSFEYTLKDWRLIPHNPGEVTLSPPFTISQNDQWGSKFSLKVKMLTTAGMSPFLCVI
jgi:hypothetical protein